MMIVTKFLRSCCGQATVGGNSSKARRSLPTSMAGGPEDCRTISLDGLNVARTSPCQLCYPFASKHGGTGSETPRLHHAARRRGCRVAISPRLISRCGDAQECGVETLKNIAARRTAMAARRQETAIVRVVTMG